MIGRVETQGFDCRLGFALAPLQMIQTGRLRLRRVVLGDAERIASGLADHAVARMLPSIPVPYDRQDALEWLLPHASGVLPGWSFAITRTDDLHLGTISVEWIHGRWTLGYWLGREHWGQGLMSEAARAVVTAFFREKPEEEIFSSALADNPASLSIQMKLGFRITGCREVYCEPRSSMESLIETALDRVTFSDC